MSQFKINGVFTHFRCDIFFFRAKKMSQFFCHKSRKPRKIGKSVVTYFFEKMSQILVKMAFSVQYCQDLV